MFATPSGRLDFEGFQTGDLQPNCDAAASGRAVLAMFQIVVGKPRNKGTTPNHDQLRRRISEQARMAAVRISRLASSNETPVLSSTPNSFLSNAKVCGHSV
jgi:hypothetical protein